MARVRHDVELLNPRLCKEFVRPLPGVPLTLITQWQPSVSRRSWVSPLS